MPYSGYGYLAHPLIQKSQIWFFSEIYLPLIHSSLAWSSENNPQQTNTQHTRLYCHLTNHITIVVQNYFSSIIRWDSRFLVFIFFTGLEYLSFLLHFDLQKISCLLSAWAFFLDTLSLSPWISEVFFFICGTSYKSCWSAFGLIFLIIFSIKWSKREEGQFRAPIL